MFFLCTVFSGGASWGGVLWNVEERYWNKQLYFPVTVLHSKCISLILPDSVTYPACFSVTRTTADHVPSWSEARWGRACGHLVAVCEASGRSESPCGCRVPGERERGCLWPLWPLCLLLTPPGVPPEHLPSCDVFDPLPPSTFFTFKNSET